MSRSDRTAVADTTPRSSRRLSPGARRQQLLEVGAQLLRASAAGGVRVEDLTAAAGVAKGTFYLYFDSWESFLVDLRRLVIQRYRDEATARFGDGEPEADFWGWVEAEVEAAVDFHVGLGGLHNALFHGAVSDLPVPTEELASQLISVLIEFGVSIGELACEDPEVAAPLVFDVLHAASDHIARGGERDRIVNTVNLLLRRWLGAAPARR